MGEYDSSRTRVVPVFSALMDRDPTGRSWLPVLLKLGSRCSGRIEGVDPGSLISGHQRWWGDNELRVDPPKALLRWLFQNLKEPASERLWGDGETKRNRERLVAQDSTTIGEALHLLEQGFKPRVRYVLEGQSRPDAYLETESAILVVEGKRTERVPTTTTTWMPRRSQMLRHLDAAWEVRKGKRVLGMMIVEGPGGADAENPSEYWLEETDAQVKPEMLKDSFPHRTPEERDTTEAAAKGTTIEIGRRVMATPRLLRTLQRTDFKGTLALAYETDAKDPLPGAAESIGYLRGVLAAI